MVPVSWWVEKTQEALVAYTEAQRLDPSTDEAMEQAERVRGMILSGGLGSAAPMSTVYASTLPEVAEEEEIIAAATAAAAAAKAEAESKEAAAASAARAAEEASKAAKAAMAAAASAEALISPAKSTAAASPELVPAAIAMGREGGEGGGGGSGEVGGDGSGGVSPVGGGFDKAGWGEMAKGAERDSDSMSVDTSVSTQALLPMGLR